MPVQFTAYKTTDKQVITVDPHNTSQACSKCGQSVKET
ncbi:transposase [Polycladomyces sp. WAk]|uniref:Transposase n=2 Tax=Polycladomyces zharkentensis TaxID=2807616 RepID=A0ABS2WJ86_9BACL|nr:transposase [Polycladomyces sp. WAk]